jgi:hypothetical protein
MARFSYLTLALYSLSYNTVKINFDAEALFNLLNTEWRYNVLVVKENPMPIEPEPRRYLLTGRRG